MDSFDKMYIREVRGFRKFKDAEIVAYELKEYYEIYSDTKSTLQQVLNSSLEASNCYDEKEKEVLLNNAVELLKIKYNIKIVSLDPLRMDKIK